MTIREVLKKRAKAGPRDPKERFREAANRFVEAISDAVGNMGGDTGGELGDHRYWKDEEHQKQVRGRAFSYLTRALAQPDIQERANAAFRIACSREKRDYCVITALETILLLMRDERAVKGKQDYFDAVDEHAKRCNTCPARCEPLHQGYKELKRAFDRWFAGAHRFPNAARTLRKIEQRGHSGAELIAYIYGKRRFDTAVDLALSEHSVEEQAYKLIGWAKDAMQSLEEPFVHVPYEETGPPGKVAPAVGPAAGSGELAQNLVRLEAVVLSCLGEMQHPGDWILLKLVWGVLRALYHSPLMPDPEAVSLSDILRAVARVLNGHEAMERVDEHLGFPKGRWRRKALRRIVLARCARPVLDAELHDSEANPASTDHEVAAAVDKLVARGPLVIADDVLALLKNSGTRAELEALDKKNKAFGKTVKQLRDIYDESMAVVNERLFDWAGQGIQDEEALSALFELAGGSTDSEAPVNSDTEVSERPTAEPRMELHEGIDRIAGDCCNGG